jgi:cyclin H
VIKAQITPLRKKLNKCHDPERWNLVELQRVRREQASKKADSENGDAEDGTGGATMEDDGAVFGGPLPRDSKRRKVGKGLDDPFGPPL